MNTATVVLPSNSSGWDRAFNDWIDGSEVDAATVFERAQSLGLEGIVSKRKGSRYISGRSPYWLKMKNPESEAARREAEAD